MYKQKKQQGIVLLSCLVFLLLLLTLLRFNLGSTAMQEMKTGADYDQMTAQETASRVMAAAELAVLSNFGTLVGDLSSNENAEKMIAYWTAATVPSPPPTLTNRRVVIDGDVDPAAPAPILNWNEALVVRDQENEILGEYLIERFMGNGGVLAMGVKDKDTVILRITARGYGISGRMADAASIRDGSRIRSTLQNTYILSKAN